MDHWLLLPAVARARWQSLSLAILVLAGGCTRDSTETAEVSGQVLFKGKPLQGGRVTFVTPDLRFHQTANIDEKGNYKIQAPVGEVWISVNNSMLRQAAKSREGPLLKRPGAPTPEKVTGNYVRIAEKYYVPETSGLRYTVSSGPQTHNIALQDAK